MTACDEVILTVSYAKGLLGAAYYDQALQTIYLFEDRGEDAEFMLLDGVLAQVNPSTVVANRNQDTQLLFHLAKYCKVEPPEAANKEEEDESDQSEVFSGEIAAPTTKKVGIGYSQEEEFEEETEKEAEEEEMMDEDELIDRKYVVLSNKAYHIERAQARINTLLQTEGTTIDEQELFVRFRLNLNNINTVRAFGALLMYLDAIRLGVERQHLSVPVPVKGLKKFTAGSLVEIDSSTFKALDIMAEDFKVERLTRFDPTLIGSPHMSLFSLCNRTRSGVGRLMLRRWFERPTTDFVLLEKRQRTIHFLSQEANGDVAYFFHVNFAKVINVRAIIGRMKMSTMKARDWRPLVTSCRALINIGNFIKKRGVKLPVIDEYMGFFDEEVEEMTVLFGSMIDFDRTDREKRLVLQRGIDPELDFKYDALDSLDHFLHKQAIIESKNFGIQVGVEYSHVFKFMVILPEEDLDPGNPRVTQVLFTSDGKAYVKTNLMEVIDDKIGNYYNEVIDRERAVNLRLLEVLRENTGNLLGMVRAVAMLDAAQALAITARELRWCRPNLVSEPVIDADGAYHPISALLLKKSFVRNIIRSNDSYTRIKVFTGPNASGKSVYLKTVGVLVYLAHIGSFVPAEKATIGPCDRILSRVYTVDTVLDGLSTFACDVNQIATAISRATRNSLVIIDEFGKGTVTEVGLAFLASILNFWIERGSQSPHVFASSHFYALPSLLHLNPEVLSFHAMDSSVQGNELRFHYRVVDGLVSSSYATYMAREMGIEEHVVQRSSEIYDQLCQGLGLLTLPHADSEEESNQKLLKVMEKIVPMLLNIMVKRRQLVAENEIGRPIPQKKKKKAKNKAATKNWATTPSFDVDDAVLIVGDDANDFASTSVRPDVEFIKTLRENSGIRKYPGIAEPMTVIAVRVGECVLLHGICQIQSIVGHATVNLFNLEPGAYKEDRAYVAVAPSRLGCPISICGQTSKSREKESLWNEAPVSTAILVIVRRAPKLFNILNAIYSENIMAPPVVGSTIKMWSDNDFSFYNDASVATIKSVITQMHTVRERGSRFKLVIAGPQNAGKSTLARLLINSFLSSKPSELWLLDCDIGQSEMGPPGCVALSTIETPLLSPPFAHQPSFLKQAFFYGGINLESAEYMKQIVNRQIDFWRQNSKPDSILIVNTMGFIVDEGREVLEHTISKLQPTSCLFINFHMNSLKNSKTKMLTIDRQSFSYEQHFTVKNPRLREATLLAHLCHVLDSEIKWHLSSIRNILPYCVDFRNICFCMPEDQNAIKKEMIFASFNCTLVALGFYENEERAPRACRIADIDSLPLLRFCSFLDKEPLRILGYGILRGIDLETQKLYVTTPIPSEEFEKVTCIARPTNISLPSVFITAQTTESPYRAQSAQESSNSQSFQMWRPFEKSVTLKRLNKGH
ncbi:unnamed protein product, partial [Mesorhabditis belari]|uniref:DNA mismatch repair proteins mutS family domain-containing protein n=1 Tax=Mesorhabditis belari TaxID=2138241 RepID=A0AAF3JAB6_9BILA